MEKSFIETCLLFEYTQIMIITENKGQKICGKCKTPKPPSSYHRDATSRDGRSYNCKDCVKSYGKEYRQSHRKKNIENAARWVKLNKEKSKAIQAAYRERNREKLRDRQRKFKIKHPGRLEEIKRRSAQKNEENNKKKRIDLYQENRESMIQKVVQWQKDNPDKVAARQRRRRALKVGASVNDFTGKQWIELQEIFDHRCAYCVKQMKGNLTQEHITPLSKGGYHTLSNIVPACQSCNSKKARGPVLKPIQPFLIIPER